MEISDHEGQSQNGQNGHTWLKHEEEIKKDTNVFNRRFQKKSQKDRKKAEEEEMTKVNSVTHNNSKGSSWSGWGQKVSPKILDDSNGLNDEPCFTTIMKNQSGEKVKKDFEKAKKDFEKVKLKEPRKKKNSWRQLSFSDESDLIVTSPVNPWKTNPMPTSPETPSPVKTDSNFKSILNEEARQVKNLIKVRSKNLTWTLKEEKAIEDLKAFYNVDNVFDETITVVRANQDLPLATPVWERIDKK